MAATGRGAQLGVLVTGPQALEGLQHSTPWSWTRPARSPSGHMSVARVTAVPDGLGADAVLRLAGAVEQGSEHPLGTGRPRLRPAGGGRAAAAGGERVQCAAGAGRAGPGRGAAGRGPRPGRRVARTCSRCPAGGGGRRAHARTGPRGRCRRGAASRSGTSYGPAATGRWTGCGGSAYVPVLATGDREAPARAVAEALGIDGGARPLHTRGQGRPRTGVAGAGLPGRGRRRRRERRRRAGRRRPRDRHGHCAPSPPPRGAPRCARGCPAPPAARAAAAGPGAAPGPRSARGR